MMKLLKLLSTLLILLLSGAATASPLYSWTTKDGTPTYSPDPPPKGVSYVIVGPDLLPLAGEPVAPTTTQPNTAPLNTSTPNSAASSNLVLTPATGGNGNTAVTKTATKSSNAKWKPVVYANDPNPKANKPEISAAASLPVEDPIQSNQQVNQISEECFQVRQKIMLLENQFANALTAQQMDDAVVRLNVFRTENKGHCGL